MPRGQHLPLYRDKKIAAVIEAQHRRWSDPDARRTFAAKIRGFDVPAALAAEYRRLTRIKMIPAREAARMLGIVV